MSYIEQVGVPSMIVFLESPDDIMRERLMSGLEKEPPDYHMDHVISNKIKV